MPTAAKTPKAYIDSLPDDRKPAIRKLRAAINKGLPKGYKEGIQYGMLGWFVPHSVYPWGYHCDEKQPVPFASVASQALSRRPAIWRRPRPSRRSPTPRSSRSTWTS